MLDARVSFIGLFEYVVFVKYTWQAYVFSCVLTRENMITSGKVLSNSWNVATITVEKISLISAMQESDLMLMCLICRLLNHLNKSNDLSRSCGGKEHTKAV